MSTNRPWVAQYPSYLPAEISETPIQSLVELCAENTRKFAENTAFENMGRKMSYQELDWLSSAFAAYLQNDAKLKQGDRIAIQLPNTLQYPVAMIGALKAGLIVVNTNPLYTPREMQHQFNDSGAVAIVILANFASNLQKIVGQTSIKTILVTELGDMLGGLKKVITNFVVKKVKKLVPPFQLDGAISFSQAIESGKGQRFAAPTIKKEDTAFLQYTGGTTGLSKGAVLSHRNVISNVLQVQPILFNGTTNVLTHGEVAVLPLPLYHIYALTASFAFVSGGVRCLLVTNPRDLSAFIKLLKKPWHTMIGVNTLYNGLLNHVDFGHINLKSVKSCHTGGMTLQEVVFRRWLEKTGIRIAEAYGLSETSPGLTGQLPGKEKMGSIGVPFPSTDVAIMDDYGNALPAGEIGELCAKGPQVFSGYWQKDNSSVFHEGVWFKTGDIAVMDAEGFFKIVDRKKDMILVSGFNVYPNEIEGVVASHPKVLEVAAIGVSDAHSGEVVKICVVKRDPSLTEEELREFCKENFTSYKRPKFIEFLTELPKTNIGKILRRSLRENTGVAA